MNNPKTFATKGVQTDSLDYILTPKSKNNLHVSPQNNILLDRSASSQSSDTSSALCSLGDLEVYTYPNTPFLDCPRHISDCPPVTPRRVRNYGQLGFTKPPHMVSTDRRIASLPETSPPYRISQTQGTVRLASMPEQLRALRSNHDSRQYLDYAETPLKLSPDSNPRSGSSGIGHTIFSRVPRTPSPPKSPESVMIAGNDDNDPRPFLHRQPHVGTENDGGMYEHIRVHICPYMYAFLQDGLPREAHRPNLFLRYMARSRYHMRGALRKPIDLRYRVPLNLSSLQWCRRNHHRKRGFEPHGLGLGLEQLTPSSSKESIYWHTWTQTLSQGRAPPTA